MSETPGTDEPHRASPLVAMRRAWRPSAGLILLGLVAGVGFGASRPVLHQAEARVGVGSQSLGTNAVAGYVLAAQQLAADYARYVTLQTGQATIAGKLGKATASQVTSITASPIPDSTIIRIDVEATSTDIAVQAVGIIQQTLVNSINASVNATTPAAVLKQYNTVNADLITAQSALGAAQGRLAALRSNSASAAAVAAQQAIADKAQTTVDSLNTQATALQSQYQTLLTQPQTANGLRIVAPPVSSGSNHVSLLERYGLLGLAVGALLALLAAVGLDRRWFSAPAALPEQFRLRFATAPSTHGLPRRRMSGRPESPREPVREDPIAAPPVSPTPFAGPTLVEGRVETEPDTPRPRAAEPEVRQPLPEPDVQEPPAAEPVVAPTAAPEPPLPRPANPEPVTPNPYLAQAIRATLDQEGRATAKQETLFRERRRRQIRDALQEQRRELDERVNQYIAQQELPALPVDVPADADVDVPTDADTDGNGAPTSEPADAAIVPSPEPSPPAPADSDGGRMAEVHPLFGERPSKQIRVHRPAVPATATAPDKADETSDSGSESEPAAEAGAAAEPEHVARTESVVDPDWEPESLPHAPLLDGRRELASRCQLDNGLQAGH